MHGQNINLPVCVCLCVCVCVCVRHTSCQLAYRSDPLTPLKLNPPALTPIDQILYTAADFELDERHVIKNEKVVLDRLRVRQNVFLFYLKPGMLRPRGLCGLEAKLFGLGLVVSGLGLMASGLVDIGLVASNMTLINVYNLVIDVHLLEKLVFLKCNDF